jgi:hypothetical protein
MALPTHPQELIGWSFKLGKVAKGHKKQIEYHERQLLWGYFEFYFTK